uniref:Uncharacterized protein n=1 Tax=Ditylenchus dipsaci TaxID=166011 RepID=A0A915DNP3_9BILA
MLDKHGYLKLLVQTPSNINNPSIRRKRLIDGLLILPVLHYCTSNVGVRDYGKPTPEALVAGCYRMQCTTMTNHAQPFLNQYKKQFGPVVWESDDHMLPATFLPFEGRFHK